MTKLLDIDSLKPSDIQQIWTNVSSNKLNLVQGNVAWSFEGNGIRTRTTFLQSFQQLGLSYVELPNFLKTKESAADLAGYMDAFYDLYVIREGNHERLMEFAEATKRPVINAMTSQAHPCEVLTDACYLSQKFESLSEVRILLWGPTTNVFRSWHSLGKVLGLDVTHFCPADFHTPDKHIKFTASLTGQYDVVVTDAWPSEFSDQSFQLSVAKLEELGGAILLPTPPVTVGNELAQPLSEYSTFAGYGQKELLLPVQREIISYLLNQARQ